MAEGGVHIDRWKLTREEGLEAAKAVRKMSEGNGIIKEGAVTFIVNVSTLDILNRNK